MKQIFKKTDQQVRTPRRSGPNIDPKSAGCTFDAVAYAAALEVLG